MNCKICELEPTHDQAVHKDSITYLFYYCKEHAPLDAEEIIYDPVGGFGLHDWNGEMN